MHWHHRALTWQARVVGCGQVQRLRAAQLVHLLDQAEAPLQGRRLRRALDALQQPRLNRP